jgi:putative transcriptional regulator
LFYVVEEGVMAARELALMKELARLAKKELRGISAPILRGLRALRKELDSLEKAIGSLSPGSARGLAPRRTRRAGRRASVPMVGGVRMTPARIRSLRRRLGLSQQNMAKVLGVSAAAVQTWEQGRSKPRGRSRAALEKVAKMSKAEAQARTTGKAASKRKATKARKKKARRRKKTS